MKTIMIDGELKALVDVDDLVLLLSYAQEYAETAEEESAYWTGGDVEQEAEIQSLIINIVDVINKYKDIKEKN